MTTVSPAAAENRLKSLGIFIELERRLRESENIQALAFQLVNETHALSAYRQAVLWQADYRKSGTIVAVSGLPHPDSDAPFITWIKQVAAHLQQEAEINLDWSLRNITARDLPASLSGSWSEWLPAQVLWIPLRSTSAGLNAGLLLARETAWSEPERLVLGYLAGAAAHAWSALLANRKPWLPRVWRSRRTAAVMLVVLLALAFFPVTQTSLVEAEVVASNPVLVRAPFDGIIDRIPVQPNQVVSEGELLFALDSTRIRSQLDVAAKSLSVAETEFRQAQQAGLQDSRMNSRLALLKGEVDQHRAELSYLEDLASRVEAKAPLSGILFFDDVNDWLGRPVGVGERIMQIADPEEIRLEIRAPVADMINVSEGSRVRVFLNTDPHRPVEATLSYSSYQANLTAEGFLAYRLTAEFADETRPLRIGLQGTAKLYGERTVLVMYLLRRPLRAVRQVIGL